MSLFGGFYSLLILLYVAVLLTVAVLVIWALALTIQLLRSVLAERKAREAGGMDPGYGPTP
jgi:heme exporter protein D